MHSLAFVVFNERPANTAAALAATLAPHIAELGGTEDVEFRWTSYQVGGRWSGVVAHDEGNGRDVVRAFLARGCPPSLIMFVEPEYPAPKHYIWIAPDTDASCWEVARLLETYHRDSWLVVVDLHS